MTRKAASLYQIPPYESGIEYQTWVFTNSNIPHPVETLSLFAY